jgi:Zn-dependent protease with chaperone function
MKKILAAACLAALSACTPPPPSPVPGGAPLPPAPGAAPTDGTGAPMSRSDYDRVVARVEPTAEAMCREEAPGAPPLYCDFLFGLDRNPGSPPNAFQTRDATGRPVIVMTRALLGEMDSRDEIAFVLGHEAAHHIARHLPRQQQSQVVGALILGGIATAAGGDYATPEALQEAMDMGAFLGGRAYSQDYELEADWIGAFITARAGYDPERGAQIFARPALASSGGPRILSTHPASPDRLARVSRVSAEIRRQQAAGLTPSP